MRRRIATIGVAAALVLLATACGGSSGSDTAKSDPPTSSAPTSGPVGKPETTDVAVGTFLSGTASLTVFAAQELGYFKDAGLNVTFKNLGLPTNLIPGLSSGDVQFAYTGYETTFNAINGGIDVVALREMAHNAPGVLQLFVSKKSGIKSIADLKGKSVGVPGVGGFGDFLMAEALKSEGLTLEDIKLKEAIPPAVPGLLEKGELDAAWLPAEFATAALVDPAHKLTVLVDFHDIPALSDVGIGALTAKRDFVEKDPNATRLFVDAVDKAAKKLEADPALVETVTKKNTELEQAIIDKLPDVPYTGPISKAKLEKQQKLFVEDGVVRKAVDLDKVIYPVG